ncbi:uncharacterized protein PgNI_02409 [Pyricularia grisea]|uniref:Uncharacterized protein n=1 Tax=Pyricularia grisea TaxID=148305 RepID=A0A6P8BLI0_PYRGI|nr:uncharacterized protein PgNI_02409 [Pyricularia grisea]TLD17549.1 hypothetical protein PgNI_02409 [Pyricularia grisea]
MKTRIIRKPVIPPIRLQPRVASSTRQFAVREVSCVEGFPLPFAPSKEGSGTPIVRDEKVDKPVILLQNKPLVAISAFQG